MTKAKTGTKATAKKPKAAARAETKATAKKPKVEARAGAKTAVKKPKPGGITFKCQWCQQARPLEEMTSLTRFAPVVVVCRSCARKIH